MSQSKEQKRTDWRQNMISPNPLNSADYYAEHFGEEESHYGKGPKDWKKPDEKIREEVCEIFLHSPIDASGIEVFVNDGVVKLTGVVEGRSIKRAAEDMIEDLPGVEDILNQLKIRPIKS